LKRIVFLIGLVAALSACFAPAVASAAPDRTVEVKPSAPPVSFRGTMATGANANYDAGTGTPCGKTPPDFCESTLVNANAGDLYATRGGGLQVTIGDYEPNPASDFDLYIYRSDAAGNRGPLVASSAGTAGSPESTTIKEASGFYLVQAVYFTVTASSYQFDAKFVTRSKIPPDVDAPAGLPNTLASDPALGFRSRSEPHMAQSPINPNILVAGSKVYNRDRDSLAEYEFKIGTYVSFDAGKTWSDMGQMNICPRDQAPPESWPNNRCYPEDDPNLGGSAPEDLKDPQGEQAEQDPSDDRGTGDFGEEYITSDIWIDFDDEGNVYAMVLDSPPYDLPDPLNDGNGFGMTFHRWETPSPEDLRAGGKTWSDRIPINKYNTPAEQSDFLDDKNTFAVNNAGPDGDGKPGIMVACWGQNITSLVKQQTVCERSTDGGRSWPEAPKPISDAEQLVIGVHVVADEQDPNTFYATWLEYAQTLGGAPGTYRFAKSTDGGQTFTPATIATTVNQLPRTFPGQAFRNLSNPIMAVGPRPERNGESAPLYLTYPEYVPTSDRADEDGMRSQIRFVKSTNGGLSWSTPRALSATPGRGDQFQQYIRITPSGQINVSYFDRRLDPENFFIDLFLSRSDDGGNTFNDTRLSHDAWDPGINPPISTSGEFIGDYQGFVANDCNAIAFYNDTHLANDAARDPDFDQGLPRSQFQQVFSWTAPNTPEFGGKLDPRCVAGAGAGGGSGSGGGLLPGPDKTAPTARLVAPRLASDQFRSGRIRLRFLGSDAGTGITRFALQVRELGARTGKYRALTTARRQTALRFNGRPGKTYQFRLRGIDGAGNRSRAVSRTTIVPLDDRVKSARFRGFRQQASPTAWLGTYQRGRNRSQSLTFNYRGRDLYLIGLKSRLGGKAVVTFDGRSRVIDTYSPKTIDRAVLLRVKAKPTRLHKVVVRPLHKKGPASRGFNVRIDAFGILRRR